MQEPSVPESRPLTRFRTWEGVLWVVVAAATGGMLAMAEVNWPIRPGAIVAPAQAAPAVPAAPAAAVPVAVPAGPTLSATRAGGQVSPEIQGFVDSIRREGGNLVIQGWAADTRDPAKPVSVTAFAGEAALGSASVSAARADVAAYLKIPDSSLVAYGITVPAETCPAGQPVTLLAAADDKRFAELLPAGSLKLACP